VRLWDPSTGKQIQVLCEPGRNVAFAPSGKVLVTAGSDRWIRTWLADGCKPLTYFHVPDDIWRLAVAPDGQSAALSKAMNLELWNLKTGELLQSLDGHESSITALAFAPDGQTLASADSGGTIKVWDLADGRPKLSFPGDAGGILALAFSPDSTTLASAGTDERGQRVIKIWQAGRLQQTMGNAGSEVQALAFVPRGRYLASGHHNGTIRLWDTKKDEPLRSTAAHRGGVRSIAFSPDGKTLASVGDDKLGKLWDVSAVMVNP
jgi:WD40 repeat protein